MKCGVIDIGSNSMRLTVYDAERNTFRILFKEKIMTALASYVEYGALSEEGIESACSGLMEFRERLEVLENQGYLCLRDGIVEKYHQYGRCSESDLCEDRFCGGSDFRL